MITTAPLDPFSKCHLQNIWWGFALLTPSVLPSSLFNIDYALFRVNALLIPDMVPMGGIDVSLHG